MGFIKEFKQFALKGNVIDLAVGVIIGGAFGGIVKSLVDDIITPAILIPALKAAKLTNLSDLTIPGTAIKYGKFLSEIISFALLAFVLFLIIKAINRAKRKDDVMSSLTKSEVLLTEIRDLLKEKK